MGSSQQGSNELGRGKVNKSDKTRRCWIQKEEEILIASLKELIAQGWKSDYGFKPGYLIKLEEAMKRGFPGTDLKGVPHINSKLSSWKKDHSSLIRMLSHSGIRFNLKGNHRIDCEDDLWDKIVKNDSNARLMRYKSYPFLEDWKEIFGKDRASRQNAEVVRDIVNKLQGGGNLAGARMGGDNHVSPKGIIGKDIATGENAEDVMDMANDLKYEDNLAGAGMGGDNHVSPEEIIGKDRVTGENSEDVMDMVNDLKCEDNLAGAGMADDNHVSPKEAFEKDAAEDILCQSEQSDRLQRQAETKRMTVDRVQGVRELLDEIHRKTDARLMDMLNDLKREDDLAGAGMAGDNHVSPKEISEKDASEDSLCESEESGQLQRQAKKKGKAVDGVQSVCELLDEIHRKTDARLMDMLNDLKREDDLAGARLAGDNHVSLKEISEKDAAEDSLCESEESDRLQGQAKKKGKAVDREQVVSELLAEIHRNTNEQSDRLQRQAKKKRKAADRVQGVSELLAEIHRNTSEQRDRLQRQAKKKRKRVDRVRKVCELLAEIQRNTNARLDNLVNRIGYEFDLGKARSEVFNHLDKIPGLTLDEKFDVCEILAAKDGPLQVFMGLPDSVRPQYAARLLKSKGV